MDQVNSTIDLSAPDGAEPFRGAGRASGWAWSVYLRADQNQSLALRRGHVRASANKATGECNL